MLIQPHVHKLYMSISERTVHLHFGSVQHSTIPYRGEKTLASDTASIIPSHAHQLVCHSPTSTLCQVQHSHSPADERGRRGRGKGESALFKSQMGDAKASNLANNIPP